MARLQEASWQSRDKRIASFRQPQEVAEGDDEAEVWSRPSRGKTSRRSRAYHAAPCGSLKAILLFPDETLDISVGLRVRVHNTFFDVVEGNDSGPDGHMSRQSSEPKDFKPTSSTSESDIGAKDLPPPLDVSDFEAPSESEVPAQTICKPTAGSCVDRTCVRACKWYWRGTCDAGERCSSCHFCNEHDAARARKLYSLRPRCQSMTKSHVREGPQQSQSPPAAHAVLGGDLPSHGSCNDAMCGQGCACHIDHGCQKENKCFFCHLCSPSAEGRQHRERLEHLEAACDFHKDKRKQKRASQCEPDGQPVAVAGGHAESLPHARNTAGSRHHRPHATNMTL